MTDIHVDPTIAREAPHIGRTVEAASSEFRAGLLAAIPALQNFARSLAKDRDHVDDLVQETLMKAWAHHESFRPGSNLEAWLFRILRNEFYDTMRRRRREIEDRDGEYARNLAVLPEQHNHLYIKALDTALTRLPDSQRRAISLVVVSGMSYAAAARACKVQTGTIKSRVNRARCRLTELMGADRSGDFEADASMGAVLSNIRFN